MKGILFDLDGTLIDSMSVWMNLDAKFVEAKGCKFKEESLDEQKSLSIDQLPKFFEETYGIATDQEEIEGFMAEIMIEHYKNEFIYKEGVEEKLKEIKDRGIKMCITTATVSAYCEHASDRLNLYDYMEFIQTPDRAGMSKSSVDYFKLAAEKLGSSPEETYVFDDALYAIENANSLGMKTVGVYDATSTSELDEIKRQADYFIESFLEIDVDKL